jgi:hypothetical protein
MCYIKYIAIIREFRNVFISRPFVTERHVFRDGGSGWQAQELLVYFILNFNPNNLITNLFTLDPGLGPPHVFRLVGTSCRAGMA